MLSLLYCGNRAIFKGVLLSSLSVAMHTDEPLSVHIMTMDLTEENPNFEAIDARLAEYLEGVLKRYNEKSEVVLHDMRTLYLEKLQFGPNAQSKYTPYTLLRLLSDLVPLPDRILYLDTDTLARADLKDLFSVDLTKQCYAGVIDYLGRVFIARDYINAGVLLLNLKHIKETGFFEKCRKTLNAKKYAFPDQDALYHAKGRHKVLPRRYNEQRKMYKDTAIRHFSKSIRWLPFYHTVNVKPWDIEGLHKRYKTFEFDDVLSVYEECITELTSLLTDEKGGVSD